jgi:hypothetical protein
MPNQRSSRDSVLEEYEGRLVQRTVLRSGDCETWRTNNDAELLFVEHGEATLEIAYGDAGTIIPAEMHQHSSQALPARVHHRLRASVPATVVRLRNPVDPRGQRG